MAARITEAEFEDKVINSEKPVVVDFYSDTCVPCKKLAPVLAQAEEDYEDKLSVYKINSNYETALAEKYGVQANPTLIFFVSGKEKDRSVGALNPMQLNAWIDKNL